jgi:hypothetical protein
MRQSQNWLTVYLIPVLLGLIIALLIILIKPDWFPQLKATMQQPINTASVNTETMRRLTDQTNPVSW